MLSIQDDLAYADGLESVTVTPPGGAPIAVAHALRRRVYHSEAAPSGGVYTRHDVKWFLSTQDLVARPEPGGTIADGAGDVWTILEVSPDALNAAWRCRARNLALAESLLDRIDVLRAVWHAGGSGAASATWIVEHADIAARIQPLESAIEVKHHQRLARITHKIYLAQPIAVDANHRIVHETTIYHVLGHEEPSRIDKLMAVLAERSPWPLSQTG